VNKTKFQLQMFLLSAVHFCWFGTYSRCSEYPQIHFSTTISI